MHTYADGGRFVGTMEADVRKGFGRFWYHFGDAYEGYYDNDLKTYGRWACANGELKVCCAIARPSASRAVPRVRVRDEP